jgi:FKBP-type peptidyl-prolyl cis-trans isomerase
MRTRFAAGLATIAALALASFTHAQDAAAPAATTQPAAGSEAAPATQPYPAELDTPAKRISYTIGTQIGADLKKVPFQVEPEFVQRGLSDALQNKPLLLTEAQMRELIMGAQREMMEKMQAEMEEQQSKNKKEGEDFLAKNKTAENVKTTASGLQYQVLKEGSGKSPKEADTVKVHYKGTFVNGTQFDSSYDRKEPAVFGLNWIIKGWSEGLQLMKEGSTYRFWVPSNLAYGEEGRPPAIPPNSTLIFDVELLEVNPKQDAPKMPAAEPGHEGHDH